MGPNFYQGSYYTALEQTKGKERYRDADFEAAFAQVAASLSATQSETSRIVEIESNTSEAEEALGKLTLETPQETGINGQTSELDR
jgi:peroxin-5